MDKEVFGKKLNETDLTDRIAKLSPAKRKLLELRLKQQNTDKPVEESIPLRNISVPPPLSFSQQRLWFLDKFRPNSPFYNISKVYELSGVLNQGALQKALKTIVTRHEVLRTTFSSLEGETVQVIAKDDSIDVLQVSNLTDLPGTEKEQAYRDAIHKEIQKPFNLSEDLMLRATLLQLDPEKNILVVVIHHIAFDGWSFEILNRELSALYESFLMSKTHGLPTPSIQYADFAAWQQEWLAGENLTSQLVYWREQMKGVPTCLDLPMDYPRPQVQTFNGAHHLVKLPRNLTHALKTLSNETNSTLFMTLLAAFKTLIYRYTGQNDIVVGSPIAGRCWTETEDLIGFFVNTLALRTCLSGELSFRDLLAQVRETALGAFAHQNFPFEKLVQELQVDRDMSRSPLVQIMFAFQNTPSRNLELPDITTSLLKTDGGVVRFDMEFHIWEAGSELEGILIYNTDLFAPTTIERMAGHFRNLLEDLAATPDKQISNLSLLTKSEKHKILDQWNDTKTDYPKALCIHQLFDTQADKTPDAHAVVYGKDTLTFDQLYKKSNQLAHHLQSMGVRANTLVGISMERSVDMILGLLSILKAGGAYVPLDPSYPKNRLAFMMDDSEVSVLLTHSGLLSQLPDRKCKTFCMDKDWPTICHLSDDSPPTDTTPDNVAYVIYTSGSTGQPKGVCVPHRAVNRLVLNTNYIVLTPSDRVAQASNASFDAATFEIWGTLLTGACLVGMTTDELLSPNRFELSISKKGITVLFLTTALFNQLASEVPQAFKKIRVLLFGGEASDPKWVKAILDHGGPENIIHVYGPTENTTFSTWEKVEAVLENAVTIPIGKPISNTTCYILDENMQPVPIGVPGELYLGGDGLALEYLNRPELNNVKFICNPFEETNDSLLYSTGDTACFLPDGNIEFLGRRDNQIKMRGFRIELGEIESALKMHPLIRSAAVLLNEGIDGGKAIIAYIVRHGKQELTDRQIHDFIEQKLPKHMMPFAFIAIDEIPLTPNGKVDRKALPNPSHLKNKPMDTYLAPRDKMERHLVEIWEKVLGVTPVGVEDDFFTIGGHSLLVVRALSEIKKIMNEDVSVADFFKGPTISQLADTLKSRSSSLSWSHISPLQTNGSRTPLFVIHGLILLKNYLPSNQPIYFISSLGSDGGKSPHYCSVEKKAGIYLEGIKSVQPHGPFLLCGYSFGGMIAMEAARQLVDEGYQVPLVFLVDPTIPGNFKARHLKDNSIMKAEISNEASFSSIRLEWDKFSGMSLRERIREVPKMLKRIYSRNKRKIIAYTKPRFCKICVSTGIPLPTTLRSYYINWLNKESSKVYVGKKYKGSVVIIESLESAGIVDWKNYFTNKLEVHSISCEHLELRDVENIEAYSQIIEDHLKRIHS